MQFTKEAIEELKQIYHEDYGVDFSDEELLENANSLVNLFSVIYKPIPKNYQSKKIFAE